MGNSVYISKNITKDQLQFLKLLNENEIPYFHMHEIEKRIDHDFSNLNEILENLVDKELLVRIERGKYRRYDFSDPYVLGAFISRKGSVGYWSALHQHDLTDRFPNKIFIKTPFRKRNTKVAETKIQFVSVKENKIDGITYSGYGNRRYPLTNVEMTLVDCFDQPRYAGPLPDLLKAFYQATIDTDKLIKYLSLYNNIAIIKRMGYLAELLDRTDLSDFISFAQENINKKYNLFDPGGENNGEFNNRWRLRMNVDKNSIEEIIQSTY